jgi:hypothetical protein
VDTANWIALVGIAAGLVAALVGAGAKIYQSRRQSRSAGLAELRDVIERGSTALTAALNAFDRRRVAPTEDDRKSTGMDFDAKVESVEALEATIATRLGSAAAARRYGEALEYLKELRDLVYVAGVSMNPEQAARADEVRAEVVRLRSDYLAEARKALM